MKEKLSSQKEHHYTHCKTTQPITTLSHAKLKHTILQL